MASGGTSNFKRYLDLCRIAVRTLKEPAHQIQRKQKAGGYPPVGHSLRRGDYFQYLLRKSGISLQRPPARPPPR